MPHEASDADDVANRPSQRGRASDSETDRLRLILDTVEEGVCELDADASIAFVNRAAEHLLDWRAGDILGRSHHDVIHHSYFDGTPLPASDCPILQTLHDGRRRVVQDGVFWKREGDRLPVTYAATPILEKGRTVGAIVTFRDLSTLIQANAEARDAQLQLHTAEVARTSAEKDIEWLYGLLELAPGVVLITRGPSHEITFANAAARSLAGARPLRGLRLAHALPEVAAQGLGALFDRVYESGELYVGVEDRVVIQPPREARRAVYLNRVLQPITLPSGDRGVFLHNVNVTREVESRREVERQVAELARVSAELERSNQELDRFAYATSHDLKAPLRGIRNLADWLEEDFGDGLEGRGLEYLTLMRSRIRRLEAMIEGLLEYSRVGRVAEARTPVDLARLVEEVIDLIPRRKVLTVAIEGSLPTIETAEVRIRQVFHNLISNAVEYARTSVVVRCREDDSARERLRFEVADDGPGIDPRDRDRIWGVFQRLDEASDRGGTGIGLALVKRIVQEAGGSAWVEATPGGGATFLFTWPLTEAGREAA